MGQEPNRLEDYKALTGLATLVANYNGPDTLAKLSHALKGSKRFIIPVEALDPALARLVGPDDRVFQMRAPGDMQRLLSSDSRTGQEHQVVFFQKLPRPPMGLGDIDPLALEVAAVFSDGMIMPVCHAQASEMRHEVSCAPAAQLKLPEGLSDEAKQDWANIRLTTLFEEAAYRSWRSHPTLPHAIVAAARTHGMRHEIFTQVLPSPAQVNYRKLLTGAFALGGVLAKRHAPGTHVALMLPTSIGATVAFCACSFAGLVPVMLNFTSGVANIVSACNTAVVKEVLTARAMLAKLPAAQSASDALASEGFTVTCLEDMRDGLSLGSKLVALARSFLPGPGLTAIGGGGRKSSDEAVVLFTSGSEGAPKGVVLSHLNLLSNCIQVFSRVPFSTLDRIFNSLPLFHSFGLVGGLSIPLLGGIRTLQFPSPLMYKEIPVELRKFCATIMFSTSTFFGKYAHFGTSEDYSTLRLAFAGGEKLQSSVRELWEQKFSKKILEGYGVTETSPVLAVSLSHLERLGSPGLMLAQVKHRLKKVPEIEKGGTLEVSGPNVMMGYLMAEDPGVVKPLAQGWHSTGDVVEFDDSGFPFIVGRLKRFAKIAGEMVPLGQVEEALHSLGGDDPIAVLAVQDPKRGESLVLLSQTDGIDRARAQRALAAAGLPELWAPRSVVKVDEVPLLPTGKIDYPQAQALAEKTAGS